jgi:hypothetical protein
MAMNQTDIVDAVRARLLQVGALRDEDSIDADEGNESVEGVEEPNEVIEGVENLIQERDELRGMNARTTIRVLELTGALSDICTRLNAATAPSAFALADLSCVVAGVDSIIEQRDDALAQSSLYTALRDGAPLLEALIADARHLRDLTRDLNPGRSLEAEAITDQRVASAEALLKTLKARVVSATRHSTRDLPAPSQSEDFSM